MKFFLAVTIAVSLCPGLLAQSQTKPDQDEIVRVETNLVQVRAVVTDKTGKPVDNLKQNDFEVLENGRPQALGFWSLERTSVSQVGLQTGAATPEYTDQPARRLPGRPKRAIVLFVDTLHLSSISLIRAKEQLKRLVDEQLSDEDMVAIVTTSASMGVFQQFMRDRKILHQAIDKIPPFIQRPSFFTPYLANEVIREGYTPHGDGPPGGGALALATQIMAAEEYGNFAPPPGVVLARAREIAGQESYFRRVTLQTLMAVSSQMGAMPGQRLIAFFSDGFTIGTDDRQEFNQAIGRAARQGVLIYSFSPSGLQTPVEFTAAAPVGGVGFARYMHDSQLDQEQSLRDVAYPTGGDAYVYNNDIGAQFQKMLESNSIYYAMGYYASSAADKKLRELKVRVRNHPEYRVRTQRSYQLSTEQKSANPATPQEKLFQAMLGPLPLTNISVTSSAGFLARADDEASVTLQIHFDGNSLEYPEKDRKFSFNCELVVAVFDQAGKMAHSFSEDVKGSLTREQVETARRQGFRYTNRLRLAPGIYQIRIGVRDVSGSLMGTAMSWVSVPELKNRKLIMSSIFLGKGAKDLSSEVTVRSENKTSRPALVVGEPSFKPSEDIFYRAALYNSAKSSQLSDASMVRVEVLQADQPVYQGEWQPLSARVVRRDGMGTEIGGQIAAKMPAGVYTLRVSVKDPESKQTISQTIEFELQP